MLQTGETDAEHKYIMLFRTKHLTNLKGYHQLCQVYGILFLKLTAGHISEIYFLISKLSLL